jgi:acetyl-CoA C-acetyltransferase
VNVVRLHQLEHVADDAAEGCRRCRCLGGSPPIPLEEELDELVVDFVEELVLAREVMVERRLLQAHRMRDCFHVRGLEAFGVDQLGGRAHDLAPTLVLARNSRHRAIVIRPVGRIYSRGMEDADPVVVVGAARTAIGRFGGAFKEVDAHELGAAAIRSAVERGSVEVGEVDEVVMGQVGQVGGDAYNARRCAITAGLPVETTAMNVNRLCGSGLQAVITGAQTLLLDHAEIVVAGGNESMSRQPFMDFDTRAGVPLGDRRLIDGTLSLVTDPFGRYPMGATAEHVAQRWSVSRQDQDAFAVRSQARAAAALDQGHFEEEIVPVQGVVQDEHVRRDTTVEALSRLRPAFAAEGTVTAGNSSGINDGAAAVVLMRESRARRKALQPLLRLRAWAITGIEPDVMGFAPAEAIPRALERAGVALDEVDLIELNEAFAAQAIAVIRHCKLDEDRVNPSGGAIALGHPVGATGAVLTVKLAYSLRRLAGQIGVVSMCIGGGQGIAAVFERP